MCRTRKWALGRSLLRICRAVSRVGCRDKDEMSAVRDGEEDLPRGRRGGGRFRMWV